MYTDCYTIDLTGFSMAPALKPGDRLVVRRVSPESIGPGDILVRRSGSRHLVAHRLIERISTNRGITKGDAVGCIDPTPIALTDPVERVDAIVRQGRLICFSGTLWQWRNRWRAGISRRGLSAVLMKQRIKKALLERGCSDVSANKYALAKFLDSNWKPVSFDRNPPPGIGSAEREGILGLLHGDKEAAVGTVERLPQRGRRQRAVVTGNLAVIGLLEKLEKHLGAERLPVMTLKGASLLNRCYASVGMRPMEDLDLMVRPEDRCRFVQILTALNFQQNRWRAERFQGPTVTLDLHVHPLQTERIQSRRHLLPEGIDSIWQRSQPWRDGCQWVRRPADEDNFLLLCLHLLKHYYARLIWLEDLRRIVRQADANFWSRLFYRARVLGCSKALAYGLYLLETLYPNFARDNPAIRNCSHLLSNLEKGLLLLAVSDRPLPLSAPLLEFLAVQGCRRRGSLAFQTLVLSRNARRAEFQIVSPLQHVYFIFLRIFSVSKLFLQYLGTCARVAGRMGK